MGEKRVYERYIPLAMQIQGLNLLQCSGVFAISIQSKHDAEC